ncbi:MAG: hypothetical protein P4L43_05540 [Syntrophobacteraceae bacterium]|nr:hypothetical protein [Syntrophobacteraceae bacterium]
MIEEKVGKQFQDDMTLARASGIRALRMQGNESTNREQREQERRRAEAKWTINRLWVEYMAGKPDLKGIVTDENRRSISSRSSGKRNRAKSFPSTWTG